MRRRSGPRPSLAAVLLLGYRIWPAVCSARFVNVTTPGSTRPPWGTTGSARVCRRGVPGRGSPLGSGSFERPENVLKFAVAGVIGPR
jgi:hypothetical protein